MNSDAVLVVHMIERSHRISRHVQSREEFLRSEPLQDLAIRSFEIIGEAASRISPGLRGADETIPWQALVGFRNVLIHRYPEVDLELVWRNATEQLPPLVERLEALLIELGEDPSRIR